ncbi:HYR domain-containing protein [Actinoplanes sp. NPDC051411]|uniref:HYR domain-containing protein n=1 Tax=Actinoplanes sp. NPDC051411 TaxID=3155522 RepID=UPI00341B2A2F
MDLSDTLAPKIYVPPTRVVEATSRAGARVPFVAQASDDRDGAVAVHYSKAPGSQFPVGRSTVTVTAQDAAGNVTHASFAVVVTSRHK